MKLLEYPVSAIWVGMWEPLPSKVHETMGMLFPLLWGSCIV